jgi:hypothetical protein
VTYGWASRDDVWVKKFGVETSCVTLKGKSRRQGSDIKMYDMMIGFEDPQVYETVLGADYYTLSWKKLFRL